MSHESRELSADQLKSVSGGMITVVGWTFTFDIRGNVSSVTH